MHSINEGTSASDDVASDSNEQQQHLVRPTRAADMPSKFNAKLRMHLRSKRLNAVAQYGTDRVVDFQFGAGDSEHHLILELYAQAGGEDR